MAGDLLASIEGGGRIPVTVGLTSERIRIDGIHLRRDRLQRGWGAFVMRLNFAIPVKAIPTNQLFYASFHVEVATPRGSAQGTAGNLRASLHWFADPPSIALDWGTQDKPTRITITGAIRPIPL